MFNSCHSERSRRISRYSLRKVRDVSTSLDMTTRVSFAFLIAIWASVVAAQESPTPTPSTTPGESPSPLMSPEESVAPPPAPEQTPSASPARSARISFVPPPLEGTISLGIYDANGKLVRVLHQESNLSEFTIGADALVTQWDGRSDNEEDVPVGKYRARGYLVGRLKVEDLGQVAESPPQNNPGTSLTVKLMPNPLANDKRSTLNLAAGFDSDGSYLKTSDDLPLFTVSESPNLTRVLVTKAGDKSLDFWQDDGTGLHRFRISNVDQMMAFDCGEFQLK
jgi:hypothetical protein